MISSFSELIGDTFVQLETNREFLITRLIHEFYPKSIIGFLSIQTIDEEGSPCSFGISYLLRWYKGYNFCKKFFEDRQLAFSLERGKYVYDFHQPKPILMSKGRVQSFNNYKLWMDNGDTLFFNKKDCYEYYDIELPLFEEGIEFK